MDLENALSIVKPFTQKWESLASKYPDKVSYYSNPTKQPDSAVLYSYPDGKSYSIGWGSWDTLSDGTKVRKGISITKERADYELDFELRKKANTIKNWITRDLNDNQFAALIDLAYNAGEGSLKYTKNGDSVLKAVNEGRDPSTVWHNIAITDSGSGKVLTNLKNRRKDEANLFKSEYNEVVSYYLRNSQNINYFFVGALVLGIGVYVYILKKKKIF